MEYLFKTVIINNYGVASYEVFEKTDDEYLCIQASWKGYLQGPGTVTIRRINKRWVPDPENFTELSALVESIQQFFV